MVNNNVGGKVKTAIVAGAALATALSIRDFVELIIDKYTPTKAGTVADAFAGVLVTVLILALLLMIWPEEQKNHSTIKENVRQ